MARFCAALHRRNKLLAPPVGDLDGTLRQYINHGLIRLGILDGIEPRLLGMSDGQNGEKGLPKLGNVHGLFPFIFAMPSA